MDSRQLTGIIKDIGRGKNAPGDLTRDDARALFTAILNDEIPTLQLGAILIALRIKGESLEELAGFLDACEASYPHLKTPADTVPLVIPSYNGARQLPNLPPLLSHQADKEDSAVNMNVPISLAISCVSSSRFDGANGSTS